MASTAEPLPYSSRRRDESEFNLREWAVKARIRRENTNSRRYSGSYMRSFREDTRSFRSNITISSTASQHRFPINPPKLPQHPGKTTFKQHTLSQPRKQGKGRKLCPKHQPKSQFFSLKDPSNNSFVSVR